MIDQDSANKYTNEMLRSFTKDKKLKDFLGSYFQCYPSRDEIESVMLDEYSELIYNWGKDNGLDFQEMTNRLLDSLEQPMRYFISLDREYDRKPEKFNRGKLTPKWFKEVRFTGEAIVNGLSLDLDEWFKNYDVTDTI